MTIHEVIQGTEEWHSLRANYFTASEASAMMGESKYMTRDALLRQKATGITEEVTEDKQRLFDKGHDAEASIVPYVESIFGVELWPETHSKNVEGLPLLASFDGITEKGNVIFEHKLFSKKLAAEVVSGELSPHYYWQLEQQLLVSGADLAIFVTSDGTPDNMEYCCYKSIPERRAKLIAGWKQFAEDLSNYQHVAQKVEPVGRAPETLPALRIEVTGMVSYSNLAEFKEHALAVIGAINKDLHTDEDFANADKTVKWCKDVEDRLEAKKKEVLGQTASIDDLFRTIDEIKEETRTTRLELDRLVKARKDSVRGEITKAGRQALADHIAALNARLGKPYMPTIAADFEGVIKGKKTVSSIHDAVNTEIARAKIAANEIADRIQINLNSLRELAADHVFLFADTAQLVLKTNDDLVAVVKSRISEHKEAEERKLAAIRQAAANEAAEKAAQAERDKIRAEEQVKATVTAAKVEPIEQPSVKATQQEPEKAADVVNLRHDFLLSNIKVSLDKLTFNELVAVDDFIKSILSKKAVA